jgi:Cytochrome C oxidase, cbb3-type, subunit III
MDIDDVGQRILERPRLLGFCHWRRQRFVLMLPLLIANTPIYSHVVLAQSSNNPIVRDHVRPGAEEFREYCAQCHGTDGTGNGPVASELKRKPANLTVLSKNNNGVFPTSEVRDFIAGTREILSHGTREMPLWGYAFMFRPGALAGPFVPVLTPEQVEQRINLLVDYLKSIQQK